MKIITTLLSLALLANAISAQISFFDRRFPPAPATRRTIVIRNGQLTGRRSAALQQAPAEPQVDQPLSQSYEDSAQEQELQEPIVQQTVPTERPQRNGNGITQQPVPSRAVNGLPRIPQQQQQFGQTVGSEEESEEEVSQRQDTALTDISMEDVSTERITPGVTFSSEEETTDDGFTPTEPEQRQVVTTTDTTTTQRKTNGNGRQRQPIGGRKTLVPSGQRAVGNGKRPSSSRNGRDRQQPTVTQTTDVDTEDAQVIDGQLTDGQISGQTGPGTGVSADGQTPGTFGTESHGGDDHHDDHHSGDPIQWLRDAIRGEPGADYPIFYTPPETGFKCTDQQYPGYYADVEARCQVFHICQENGRSDAFLCPNGTIFSQQNYVCVWWHDFDCSTAPQFYSLNAQLYSTPGTSAPDSAEPFERPGSRPSGPTRGRPSARGEAPVDARVDAIDTGFEGPADERIQIEGQQPIEGQEPDLPQVVDSGLPQQTGFDDSQEAVSEETPAPEVITTSAPINGLRAPNGRPIGGIKGIGRRNGISTTTTTRSNGNGAKRIGQNGDQQRVSLTTTRPLTGLKRIGGAKRNGNGIGSQPSVPSSPADTARNGKTRTNGANGSQQRKRPNGGTKNLFRDRTTQSKELDSQSSNQWYYYLTHGL